MEITLLGVGLVDMKQVNQVKIKVKINPKPVAAQAKDVNPQLQNVPIFTVGSL